jgi:hypothetical protein
MNTKLLIVTVISLSIILPIVAVIVHYIDLRDKRRINTGASLYIRQMKTNPGYPAYRFLKSFFLTRNFIVKVSRQYENLYPGDTRMIAARTMKVFTASAVLCLAEVFFIFLMKPKLHNAVLALLLVYVINNEVINRQVSITEIRLLEQMVIFISNVRHNYHVNRMVDDAIASSLEGVSYEMKIHANMLFKIVTSNNIKEEVSRYNAATNNKYLKLLLSLCSSVIEFDDKKVNTQLLFTSNLEHLIKEINIEILKLKKLKYVFSGTIFVTIAVCIPVDAIQSFGISIAPELESFYSGKDGILFVSIIFLSSIMVYLLINNLKETRSDLPRSNHYLHSIEKISFIKEALDNYTEKNYGRMMVIRDTLKRVGETISPRQLVLKRMIFAGITFLSCIGLVFFMHYSNLENITKKVTNIDTMLNMNGRAQKGMVEEAILQYVKCFREEQCTEKEILDRISKDGIFSNKNIAEAVSKEVYTRIHKIHSEYFHWYELIACFAAAQIAYGAPYLMLKYKKRILKMSMEDEVNQFNSIIYMLIYIDHMTVKTILEQLELFAVVFKQSIQECINEYNSGELLALNKMKEKENFGPFKRLVDNLIRCDLVSMETAFDEIVTDRENYYDRRKLENEISIQRRADIAKPLSFIPAVLVTVYLLLPLLIASLQELEGFRENLTSMGF